MAFAEDTSIAADLTSDAAFRAWVAGVRQVILDAGLTRTSDTGQIDTSTVTSPSTNAYGGYDIFQFTDAAQSTDPIIFKLEYGKGSQHSRHALRITAGTGSDGSGGIVNPAAAQTAFHNSNGSGNGHLMASFFDSGFVVLDVNSTSGTSQNALQVHVERVRDYAGALVDGCFYVNYYYQAMASGYLRINGGWNTATVAVSYPSGTESGVAVLGCLRLANAAGYPAQLRAILLGNSDISAGDSGSVSIGGASKTYKRLNFSPTFVNDSAMGYGLYRSA